MLRRRGATRPPKRCDLLARGRAAGAGSRRAQAELETARGALAAGEATQGDLVLTAPIDATVLGRYVEQGEVIGAGQVAITLGDAKRPWVRVYLPAPAVPFVKVGQAARVTVQGLGSRFAPARVASIATAGRVHATRRADREGARGPPVRREARHQRHDGHVQAGPAGDGDHRHDDRRGVARRDAARSRPTSIAA